MKYVMISEYKAYEFQIWYNYEAHGAPWAINNPKQKVKDQGHKVK